MNSGSFKNIYVENFALFDTAGIVNSVRPTTDISLSHWVSTFVYNMMVVMQHVARVTPRRLKLKCSSCIDNEKNNEANAACKRWHVYRFWLFAHDISTSVSKRHTSVHSLISLICKRTSNKTNFAVAFVLQLRYYVARWRQNNEKKFDSF